MTPNPAHGIDRSAKSTKSRPAEYMECTGANGVPVHRASLAVVMADEKNEASASEGGSPQLSLLLLPWPPWSWVQARHPRHASQSSKKGPEQMHRA